MDEIRLLKDPETKPDVAGPDAGTSGPTARPAPAPVPDPRHAHETAPGASAEPPGAAPPRSAGRPCDRRVATRYRAVDGRCWLGWHDATRFRQSAGWIIDISASGCLVASDEPPPTDRSVWLRLDNPTVPDWAEARVVDRKESASGIHAVRLVFRGTCPYALIKAVAFSARAKPAARPGPSASWESNAW